ncbi:hypothetical protein PS1_009611 [Malus domestica]
MSFTVLSRGDQPGILAGMRPACPAFQQPMRPTTSSFLSVASLARVRSKSPKDMSYVAHLALRPSATIRSPDRTTLIETEKQLKEEKRLIENEIAALKLKEQAEQGLSCRRGTGSAEHFLRL